jgi:hypothetical protein
MTVDAKSPREEQELSGDLADRIIREAIEGCGICRWARVDHWEGQGAARITGHGGSPHVIDEQLVRRGVASILLDQRQASPDTVAALTTNAVDRVDSYVADEVVQIALFGQLLFR